MTGGISIGAGISSLIASLLVEEVLLERMTAWCPTAAMSVAEFLAFIDNVFVCTTADRAEELLAKLEAMGKDYGLQFGFRQDHRHKMCFVNPTRSPDLLKWLEKFKQFEISIKGQQRPVGNGPMIPVPRLEQGIVLAGVGFGTNEFYEGRLEAKMLKAQAICNAMVAVDVHPKLAFVWVKRCVVMRLCYHLRLTPVEAARGVARRFDSMIVDTLRGIAGAGEAWGRSDRHKWWISSVWKVLNVEATLEAAFLASRVSAWRNGLKRNTEAIMQITTVFNQCVKAEDQLQAKTPDGIMGELAALKKPQKDMMDRVARKNQERNALSNQDVRTMEELLEKGARYWMDRWDFKTIG